MSKASKVGKASEASEASETRKVIKSSKAGKTSAIIDLKKCIFDLFQNGIPRNHAENRLYFQSHFSPN